MLLRLSHRGKRILLIAAAAVAAAALAVVPLHARADEIDSGRLLASPVANLTLQMTAVSVSGGNTTFTVRVLNNGPDGVADGDYQLAFDWFQGTVVPRAGDSVCVESSSNGCVIDGPALFFQNGPITGGGFVDLRITVGGLTDPTFFLNIVEVNFFEQVRQFPDFGLQPPLICTLGSCSSL